MTPLVTKSVAGGNRPGRGATAAVAAAVAVGCRTSATLWPAPRCSTSCWYPAGQRAGRTLSCWHPVSQHPLTQTTFTPMVSRAHSAQRTSSTGCEQLCTLGLENKAQLSPAARVRAPTGGGRVVASAGVHEGAGVRVNVKTPVSSQPHLTSQLQCDQRAAVFAASVV